MEYPLLRDKSSLGFYFWVFGSNSLCAFALNVAVFLLVGKTSALTMNVAGVVKDWLLIAFSWSVIKDTVTAVNLIGYGLAFLGVGYYNYCTLGWKMQAVTPCSFIDYFIVKITGEKHPKKSSISRSVQLILSIIRGIDFLEFRPSEIAAAVAVSVLKGTASTRD